MGTLREQFLHGVLQQAVECSSRDKSCEAIEAVTVSQPNWVTMKHFVNNR
jgi:hypothetical protein